jgi:hypothetical protein
MTNHRLTHQHESDPDELSRTFGFTVYFDGDERHLAWAPLTFMQDAPSPASTLSPLDCVVCYCSLNDERTAR